MKKYFLLLSFLFLVACQQTTLIQPNADTKTNSAINQVQTPVFTDKILDNIVGIYSNNLLAIGQIDGSIETLTTDSKYIIIDEEGANDIEFIDTELSDLAVVDIGANTLNPQTTLTSTDGFVVYITKDGSTTEIWRHSQADDSQTLVYSGSRDVQSVAITLDGDTVAAVMDREAATNTFVNQNKEVFAFRISTVEAQLQTVTGSDEADISISGDGKVWAWQGRNRLNNTTALIYRVYDTNGDSLEYILHRTWNIEEPNITQNGKLISFVRFRDGSHYLDGKDRWISYAYNIEVEKLFGLIGSLRPLHHPSLNDDGSRLLVERGRITDDKRIIQAFNLIDRQWLSPAFSIQDDSVHSHLSSDGLFASYAKMISSLNPTTRDISAKIEAVTDITTDSTGHFWQKPSTLPFAAGFASTPTSGTTYDFSSIDIGNNSVAQTLEVSQIGTSDLRVGYRIYGLNRADFSVAPLPSYTIASGGSTETLSITCSPTVVGTLKATLVVFTNDITQLRAQYPLRCVGSQTAAATGWIINEIHADPHTINGDANGDGTVSSSHDEFIELVNKTGSTENLADWTISDAVGVKYTFPSTDFEVANGCAVVIFGGGTANGGFGGSIVQVASGLGLNNTGDTVTLKDNSDTTIISYTYSGTSLDDQSQTRDSDLTGNFVLHSNATNSLGTIFSPGTQVDGTSFANNCTITSSDITAPTITALSPADDSTNIAIDSDLVITFDEAVQAGTGNVTIYNSDVLVETIAISDAIFSGNTVTLNPENDFSNSNDLYVHIDTTAIEDVAGNSFVGIADVTTWSFSTLSASTGSGNLVITGIIDGPLSGGTPKAVELYAKVAIADLSIYGVGSANNGDGSDGEEFSLSGSATAGQFIYVAYEGSNANAFFDFLGFTPDFIDPALNVNGNDAIELFVDGTVIDVFGDINLNGSGQVWDYVDSWAYRNNGTGSDGTMFTAANWFFGGINTLDDVVDNGTATIPFPIGTYTP